MITKNDLIELVNGKSNIYVKRKKLEILEDEIIEKAVDGFVELNTSVHNAYKEYFFEKLKKSGYKINISKEGTQVTDFKISWDSSKLQKHYKTNQSSLLRLLNPHNKFLRTMNKNEAIAAIAEAAFIADLNKQEQKKCGPNLKTK